MSLIRSTLIDKIREKWKPFGPVSLERLLYTPAKYFHSSMLIAKALDTTTFVIKRDYPTIEFNKQLSMTYYPDIPCEHSVDIPIGNMCPLAVIVGMCKLTKNINKLIRQYYSNHVEACLFKKNFFQRTMFLSFNVPFLRALFLNDDKAGPFPFLTKRKIA